MFVVHHKSLSYIWMTYHNMTKIRYFLNMKTTIEEFDWKKTSELLKKLLKFNSKNSITPINADRWEELIYNTLKFMGEKTKWNLGSHQPGADIWTDKFAISAKSGKIQDNNIVMSSYRLTRFDDIEEMKKFIDSKEGKNFDFYLCCVRTENPNGSRIYDIYFVDADVFHASDLDWEDMYLRGGKTHSGWRGINERGIKVEIRRKMSNQLWMYIPLELCKKLLEVTISREELGSEASKPLEEDDE